MTPPCRMAMPFASDAKFRPPSNLNNNKALRPRPPNQSAPCFDFLPSAASPREDAQLQLHPWPTDHTLEASELPALDLWFAPPLLSSCLLQSCYMIITHGTQHDHTSSSELNRNMFAGALHDNLCGRSRG